MTDSEKNRKIAEWLGIHIHEYELHHSVEDKCTGWRCKEPSCGRHNLLLTTRGVQDSDQTCVPNFTTSDIDAITLLPVLVERGWYGELCFQSDGYIFEVSKPEYRDFDYDWETDTNIIRVHKPTISAVITEAVLELIEKEGHTDEATV